MSKKENKIKKESQNEQNINKKNEESQNEQNINKKNEKSQNEQNINKKNEKSQNEQNINKKNKESNKTLQILKKKWLINGTNTIILVLLIILIFIAINIGMKSLELTPIDLTQEKLYTLTEESKEKIKNIDKNVNMYFVGYSDDDSNLILAKQYKTVNEKIVAEAVKAENRPDLVEKYGIEDASNGIIIECDKKSKVLTANDLVTYDSSTYETISIAEEKMTTAILSVVADKVPNVYFLEGYSNFSLNYNMNLLNIYLQNEITTVKSLNILSTGNVPEDCDVLVITSPTKDFDDIIVNAITEYINKGKNILWLNAAMSNSLELLNVNKILSLYGVKPFEVGVIKEEDTSRMISNSSDLILPILGYSEITEDIYQDGVVFKYPTKINIDEEELTNLKVKKTDLATTSEKSYFRTDFSNENISNVAQENEEKGSFIVGAELEKTIIEANEENDTKELSSSLIIIGENFFISDHQIASNFQNSAIQLAYNKDLVLNSLAYLSDREEDITARKSTGTVTYTATEEQDTIVRIIIFSVPIIIIFIGLIVWKKRRRKK